MQVRHPYEYGEFSGNSKGGWRFNGKKLSRDWVYVWAVKNQDRQGCPGYERLRKQRAYPS